MADYLEAYVAHHRLPVETGVRVDRVTPAASGDGFDLAARDARYRATQVIVATGPFQRPFVPDFADRLDPAIRQLHAADYRNPSQLAVGPVLVVGVSHSGADIAHEAATAGLPTMLAGVSAASCRSRWTAVGCA
jgi:putative flavoprotein involved in K+ transport